MKSKSKKVDGRTKAGRMLARKRAAMATARKARWAKRAQPVGRTLSAQEVIKHIAPEMPTFIETPRNLDPIMAPTLPPSAPGAYTREVPRR